MFDGIHGNPTCAMVMAGAAAFKAHGADSVIGFGGGAALDVAKIVGLMATHDGDVLEYVWDHPQLRPIVNPLPHFVALPDQRHRLGSRPLGGGERERHARQAHRLQAEDPGAGGVRRPELTLALPPAVTAATGMDALTHNIESYLSPAYHPMCDGIALEGLRLARAQLASRWPRPATCRRVPT